ncbi:reduced folate transporter isoform X3 [Mustela putorius furo]|uniref:Reduced folate transporter isoform X3 n=1 Tax=Mustela putorius furo TaxID=9669 RepID=A0A8U0V7E0_MUSPF|nr:reduced folate transporter isoform X3 [Mustela putorius furo]
MGRTAWTRCWRPGPVSRHNHPGARVPRAGRRGIPGPPTRPGEPLARLPVPCRAQSWRRAGAESAGECLESGAVLQPSPEWTHTSQEESIPKGPVCSPRLPRRVRGLGAGARGVLRRFFTISGCPAPAGLVSEQKLESEPAQKSGMRLEKAVFHSAQSAERTLSYSSSGRPPVRVGDYPQLRSAIVSSGAAGGLGSMVPSGQVVEKDEPAEPGPDPEPDPELKSWRCLVFYLCFYGFMAQLRPGESFITPYLLSPDKNFTREQPILPIQRSSCLGATWIQIRARFLCFAVSLALACPHTRLLGRRPGNTRPRHPSVPLSRTHQVTNEITPVLSYSYLAVLVPMFLLTDYLRYTPVLVLQSASFVAAWLLLLLGRSVLHMQLMELCYSVTMAARIAYSSYIFSLVRPARYQRMAGYSRSAALLGVFTSSVLGQLLVSAAGVPFSTLNLASLGLLCCSLLLALFLRRPRRSLFFNRDAAARRGAAASELARMNPGAARGAWRDWTPARVLRELGATAHSPQLRLWSLWWVFNSAAYYLIVYYVHILWNVVHPTADSASVYNGGADAASTLLGAITSFSAGFVKIRWALWAKLVIAGVTAAQAALVFLMYSTNNIWLCYLAFVLFRGAYQFLVPIATFSSTSCTSWCCLASTSWGPWWWSCGISGTAAARPSPRR